MPRVVPAITGCILFLLSSVSCGDRQLVESGTHTSENWLPAITLFTPINGYARSDRRPDFTWAATSSYEYTIFFSYNGDMSAPFTNIAVGQGTEGLYQPDFDLSGTVPVYWQVRGSSSRTGTAYSPVYYTIPPLQALDLCVSEVNWAGARDDAFTAFGSAEYIELYNQLEYALDISGYRLLSIKDDGSSTNSFLLPQGTSIPGKGFYVIARNDEEFDTAYQTNAFTFWQPEGVSLVNGGFRLHLLDKEGNSLDYINAGDGGFTPVGSSGSTSTPRSSMERNLPIADGSLVGSWSAATNSRNVASGYSNTLATPGTTNSGW